MQKINSKGFAALELVLIVVIIAIIGGLGVFVYKSKQTTDKNSQAQSAPTSNTTPVVSIEDQIIAAAKTNCVSETKGTFTLSTTGPNQKKVTYSADKQFAELNAACAKQGESAEGNSALYVLKLIGSKWQVIDKGTMSNPDKVKQYSIPSDFN